MSPTVKAYKEGARLRRHVAVDELEPEQVKQIDRNDKFVGKLSIAASLFAAAVGLAPTVWRLAAHLFAR
jgi:hypothetical protein